MYQFPLNDNKIRETLWNVEPLARALEATFAPKCSLWHKHARCVLRTSSNTSRPCSSNSKYCNSDCLSVRILRCSTLVYHWNFWSVYSIRRTHTIRPRTLRPTVDIFERRPNDAKHVIFRAWQKAETQSIRCGGDLRKRPHDDVLHPSHARSVYLLVRAGLGFE